MFIIAGEVIHAEVLMLPNGMSKVGLIKDGSSCLSLFLFFFFGNLC